MNANFSRLVRVLATLLLVAAAALTTSAQSNNELCKQYLNEGYGLLREMKDEQAVASFRRAVEADPANVRARLDLAYTLLSSGKDKEAITAFQQAIQLDPENVQVRSQLGYLYIHQGQTREALGQFLEVEKRDPHNEQVKTQLGYLYDKLGDKQQARELFAQVANSSNADLRAKAQTALRNLQPAGGGYKEGTFVSEVYAAPFYQQRFGNFIAPLVIRNGLVLESAHAVEAYASLRLTRDTRSSAGSAPQIYSDNFLVAGVGLRARPFKNNLTVYGEAGIAKNLLRSSVSTVRARSDFRAGVYYSREWDSVAETANPSAPMKLVGDVYFDASYYSRFRNNFIAFGQAREGLRFFQWNKSSLDLYGRASVVKDSGRDFYNNVAETAGGLRFTPWRPLGVSVSGEYVQGFYFGTARPGEPNPYGSRYNDFRVMLTVGKYYAKE